MLTLYVWWLLQDAATRGLDRLYFLARDGQVLLEIARILQAAGCAPELRLQYLFASRQAWFAPSITCWSEAALFRILDEPDRLADPAKLAKRLGFVDSQAMRARWPILVSKLRPELTNRQVAALVVGCVPAAAGLEHVATLRRLALDYLGERGVLSDARWAIVDLGWRGRLQEALSHMMQAVDPESSTRGYYMRLLEPHAVRPAGWHAATMCDDAPTLGPAHLIEMLCEAAHGSTAGYARSADGRAVPVYEPEASESMRSWGLACYRAGVMRYATELAATLPMLGDVVPSREALHRLAVVIGRELFGRPPQDIAKALASMPCSHSVNHDRLASLAEPLPLVETWLRAVSLGRLRLSQRGGSWLPGSLALAGSSRPYRVYRSLHQAADALKRRLA